MGVQPVNLAVLHEVFDNMVGRVHYQLGAKAPGLGVDTSTIHVLDCSGFVRFALARATGGGLVVPDGSQQQLGWCAAQGLRELPRYSLVAELGRLALIIAFLTPESGMIWPRHVWMLRGGLGTMECCSGEGVCSMPWDEGPRKNCVAAFELPAQ